MRTAFLLALLFLGAVARAENVSVSPNLKIIPKPGAPRPGEAQSTVVPPDVKIQCPAGRLLVTNDALRPPAAGLVTGRDLDKASGPDVPATFDEPPGQKSTLPRYDFVTNDHDLLTLPNGDVLYLTGAASRAPVDAPWFESAYRDDFGPGARSVVLTWRSSDCGRTFHYTGEFDPAHAGDGSCALPQFHLDPISHKIIEHTPHYDMGGADGQTVQVDRATGRLYLTFSCVGYHSKGKGTFTLDPANPVNRTLLAVSENGGATWQTLGALDRAVWRLNAVPLDAATFAFGIRDGVALGTKNSTGWHFDKEYTPDPTGAFGWPNFPFPAGATNPWILTYMFGHTLTARTPGTHDAFIVYATTADKRFGYRLAFHDHVKNQFADAPDPIVPATGGANDFILHPAVIDNGAGPVLLYWNDVDAKTMRVTVRGRLIFGQGDYSNDFAISVDEAGQPRSFTVVKKGPPGDWYGDYQTAGGFRMPGATVAGGKPFTLDVFYPIWIEPGGVVHFARVRTGERGDSPPLRRVFVEAKQWHRAASATPLSTLPLAERHETDVRRHD